MYAINYRPVLIEGRLEVSYPSSTTLLVLSVMPTAIIQGKHRRGNLLIRRAAVIMMCFFTILMVAGRMISCVHWFIDIVGGIILSVSLVMSYKTALSIYICKKYKKLVTK